MIFPALLGDCTMRDGATELAIRAAERALGVALPDDYKGFLGHSDGLEGFVTEESYLSLWSTSDLPGLNSGYSVSEFVAGVTLLGTDGADTGYGFRMAGDRVEYLAVPLIGMRSDAVSVLGSTFQQLLEQLAGHGSEARM